MAYEDDEYCLLVNAGEHSPLWSLLADWADSDDEEVWRRHIPRFAEMIARWHRGGWVRLYQGEEWPADLHGHEVTAEELPAVLADPGSWEYHDYPERVTVLVLGDIDITDEPPRELAD